MDEQNMAANADAVIDTASEGVADLQTETTTATENVETVAEPTTQTVVPTTETTTTTESQKEVTQTQAFAKRLAEEKAKAEQAVRDAMTAEIYGEQGITTYDALQKAREDAKRQAEIDRLVQQNFPREIAEELTELRRLKEAEKQRESAQAAAALKQKETFEFFEYFKETNGREYTAEDGKAIPPEVFDNAKRDGVPLKYAYADHLRKVAQEKLKSVDLGKQTAEANAANATNSTGSVIGNGAAADSVLTEESIAAMSDKQRMSRWADIKKFYNMK